MALRRKFNGDWFSYHTSTGTKKEAIALKEKLLKKGFRIRVVKSGGEYLIYSR